MPIGERRVYRLRFWQEETAPGDVWWVAVCLDQPLAVQARTLEGARESWAKSYRARVAYAKMRGLPLWPVNLKPIVTDPPADAQVIEEDFEVWEERWGAGRIDLSSITLF